MAARFEPPVISDNPTGWGPSTIPAQFKDMVSLQPSIPLSCYTSPLTPLPLYLYLGTPAP